MLLKIHAGALVSAFLIILGAAAQPVGRAGSGGRVGCGDLWGSSCPAVARGGSPSCSVSQFALGDHTQYAMWKAR